jgi:hypothetical protein
MQSESNPINDEEFDSEGTAKELILEYLSKLNKGRLKEFCKDNDVDMNLDELASYEVNEARKEVFDLIRDQIGFLETAESLSEDIVSNFFYTKNIRSIEKFCTKYDLPEYFQKSLGDEDPQKTHDFLSRLILRLRDEPDFISIAKDLGIKYLFSGPSNEKPSHKRKPISWDDVGEYMSENELARILRCSVKTLRNNRSLQRGLTYTTIGGSIRYPKKNVKKYLAKHTTVLDE